jgi:hypothetical protein
LTSNIQAMMYVLAMTKQKPEYKNIMVKFLFLRYPKKPEQECPQFTQEQLSGFEYFLEHISNYLSDFNEQKAISDFAAKKIEKKWMCKTKSGWKCPYLEKFKYKVLLDKNKKIIKTCFLDESFSDSDIKDGFSVDERQYEGCPALTFKKVLLRLQYAPDFQIQLFSNFNSHAGSRNGQPR